MITKGISLWIMPKSEIYQRLKNLISVLAEQCKGPVFQPHITLLGEILESQDKIIEKTVEIAQETHYFNIKLREIAFLDQYFRCLFVKAKSEELLMLNKLAQETFSKQEEFMPHLSLLYGDIPIFTKQQIVSDLEINEVINVNSIFIVKTDGNPSTWKVIREIPLRP